MTEIQMFKILKVNVLDFDIRILILALDFARDGESFDRLRMLRRILSNIEARCRTI